MTSKPVIINLRANFKGFVQAVVHAQRDQKLFFKVKDIKGQELASATFTGTGVRQHMKDIVNRREYWSFGPFNFNAILEVMITSNGKNSKMIGPLEVHKKPEQDYPIEFISATVISEDGGDADHDDCTVTILQYK